MLNNLSSKITLEQIPAYYYRNDNPIEKARRAKLEKIDTDIFASIDEAALSVAQKIAHVVTTKAAAQQNCVLVLPGGVSPIPVYKHLVQIINQQAIALQHVHVFVLAEFFPLPPNSQHSNTKLVVEHFLSKVNFDLSQLHSTQHVSDKNQLFAACRNYEAEIEALGGIDFLLSSVGLSGSLGYNEPGSQPNSITRLMMLDSQSRSDLKQFFVDKTQIPAFAITIGLNNILAAKELVVIGWGENKAAIAQQMIEAKMNDHVPASFLQMHKNALVVLDLGAASQLTRISKPWLVGSCDWNDKLTRRAIVWLSQQCDKPILKLTNKDYNQHGLDELLAQHGSAYNVNIKVFNDLQHTITGWPGGKPSADDTHRPERALPYPKKVLLFSPHPDDDVISMGGTFQRLVDQGHQVHVAYQTSGNIAVGDDEIIRSVSYMYQVMHAYDNANTMLKDLYEKTLHFLQNKKQAGDVDISEVLFLKGQMRRAEARAACRFVGVKPENVHFLDLPFYETGKVKKGELTQADVDIVKDLISHVQPHQIYVAGDLADPHGTHKVCLDAALAALHELKANAWMADCRIWMYRGAWAEWEIDHIEMAVPMSPEQLRQKRNAILKHQSQMESAPFMGNDERLFWQRSEDRNRATAKLYQQLGLAAYEAIEAFVEYKI